MKIFKYEFLLFYILCLVSILPLLFTRYYVTLDGPTHLYNANLIRSLVFHHDTEILNLFRINPMAVPNWMGHFLMAFFGLFLPAFLSEKITLLLYFILTPIFFRKFILLFNPSNKSFSYLMLLFTHNFLLYFGSFNMMLGVMFLFITLFYFHKNCQTINVKNIFVLGLLLLMVYFSHFMIYSIALCFLVALSFYSLESDSEVSLKKRTVNKLFLLILSALPSLILAAQYFLNVDSVEEGAPRLPFKELINWIVNVRPLLTLSENNPWKIYTNILFVLFVVVIINQVVFIIKKIIKAEKSKLNIKLKIPAFKVVCLLASIVFLILYFILPNAIILTYRLIYLFYIIFILWVALIDHPKWLHYLTLMVIIIIQVKFTSMYIKEMRSLSREAQMFEEVSRKIDKGSTVLTLNYSDNWLHQHISGYLGCNKTLAVLENYEAALKWFPIQWNRQNYKIDRLDIWGVQNKNIACDFYINTKDSSCFSLTDINNNICPIKYVVKFGDDFDLNDPCNYKVNNLLENCYSVVMQNDLCILYKKD